MQFATLLQNFKSKFRCSLFVWRITIALLVNKDITDVYIFLSTKLCSERDDTALPGRSGCVVQTNMATITDHRISNSQQKTGVNGHFSNEGKRTRVNFSQIKLNFVVVLVD